MAKHGIELVKRVDPAAQEGRLQIHRPCHLGNLLLRLRQEFVERRVEQADRHRQAMHDREELREVRSLHRQESIKGLATARFILGKDHLAHHLDAVALEEHMFGPAQTDSLRAERAC